MLRSQVKTIADFSGGQITKANILALKDSQSPNCLNVHSNLYGVLQKRGGFDSMASTYVDATASGKNLPIKGKDKGGNFYPPSFFSF